MKATDIQDAIGLVDPVLIARAEDPAPIQTEKAAPLPIKTRRLRWTAAVAAVLVLALAVGMMAGGGLGKNPTIEFPVEGTTAPTVSTTTTKKPGVLDSLLGGLTAKAETLTKVEYPEMAPYPNEQSLKFEQQYDAWRADKNAQAAYNGAGAGLEDFFRNSIAAFLSDAEKENRVYAPLNVYMALAMLAETTDGTSRSQILNALGAESIESLRRQANAVWNANYSDDGAVTSILASSLWMNQDVTFNKDTLGILADNYYASSYRGEMGTDAYNKALQKWINDQTGGLLKEQVDGIEMTPETVMALVTTIFFQAKWDNEFSPQKNETDTFHGADTDVLCDFMNRTETYGNYYWGDRFSAAGLSLEGSGTMWFVLPDEGASVEALLSDEQAMDFLVCNGNWNNKKSLKVNFRIPKFDVNSQMDLADGLQALGITDCFASNKADFSPLSNSALWLDKVQHGARVAIDEEGVTAAAYSVMQLCGAPMPPEDEVDFVLDRPFLFVITGADGLPLFTGVVNQP